MGLNAGIPALLAVLFCIGQWLIIASSRKLYRRARELNLWPQLKDRPEAPWSIYPEWSYKLLLDVVAHSDQHDMQYRSARTRMRAGIALSLLSVLALFVLVSASN